MEHKILQEAVFEHMQIHVREQIKIRRGEMEGVLYDLATELRTVIYPHDLITMQQLDILLRMLNKGWE